MEGRIMTMPTEFIFGVRVVTRVYKSICKEWIGFYEDKSKAESVMLEKLIQRSTETKQEIKQRTTSYKNGDAKMYWIGDEYGDFIEVYDVVAFDEKSYVIE